MSGCLSLSLLPSFPLMNFLLLASCRRHHHRLRTHSPDIDNKTNDYHYDNDCDDDDDDGVLFFSSFLFYVHRLTELHSFGFIESITHPCSTTSAHTIFVHIIYRIFVCPLFSKFVRSQPNLFCAPLVCGNCECLLVLFCLQFFFCSFFCRFCFRYWTVSEWWFFLFLWCKTYSHFTF